MKYLTIVLLAVLASPFCFAAYQEKPEHCLKSETLPCAVWALHKTHLPRAGMQIYVSANTLFEIRSSEIYLIRGNLWLITDRPVTVSSRFGSVKTDTKNEIWAEASDESLLARAFYREMQVLPRGSAEAITVDRGFEMRLSYIDSRQGVADYTWPALASLPTHLKSFQTLVPSDEVFTEKTAKFAEVLVKAVKVAAQVDQQAIERKLASDIQTKRRLKYEQGQSGGRDSYLRQLFRKKSDFEE